MTEEQIRQRIKEINEQEERLRQERHKYDAILAEQKRNAVRKDHQAYVGKCYSLNTPVVCYHGYIRAFKIIEVLDVPNENYATCLAIIKGTRHTCFQEYGIQIETLPLWTFDSMKRSCKIGEDPLMIDLYTEISQEIFDEKLRKSIEKMKNYADNYE